MQQASLRDMLHLLRDSPQNMDAQIFLASFERLRGAFSSDGLCTPLLAREMLQAMHEAEPSLRLEQIDPLRSVNNSFVQRSAARLRG